MRRLPLYREKERVILAELVIGLIKIIHAGRLGRNGSATLGGEVETLLISEEVLIRETKGKTRRPTDISRSLGIPRATVVRKLSVLVRNGVIARRADNSYHAIDLTASTSAYIDRSFKLIGRLLR